MTAFLKALLLAAGIFAAAGVYAVYCIWLTENTKLHPAASLLAILGPLFIILVVVLTWTFSS